MRKERRQRAFENKVLRKIIGPKRAEVTGELYGLYSSPNVIRVMRWAGHVVRMGKRRGAYRV
jgi:hypothetical protein